MSLFIFVHHDVDIQFKIELELKYYFAVNNLEHYLQQEREVNGVPRVHSALNSASQMQQSQNNILAAEHKHMALKNCIQKISCLVEYNTI